MSQIQVELQETMGSDASICNAAWTSTYDKDKREAKYDDPAKVAELVPRLIREGHSTPIESVVLRFWLRIPIFVDRQVMTHRIASHNGLSGRYRTMPDDYFHMPDDVLQILDKSPGCYQINALNNYYANCCDSVEGYNYILSYLKEDKIKGTITDAEYKRCREVLRGMLPTATMVERTTILNLRSFANFYRLRSAECAQKEIQEVARLMLAAVEAANVAPIAVQTLKEVGWRI